MEEKRENKPSKFDALFTTNQIQIIKILLPNLPFPLQKGLAVYIKLQELQYTIAAFDQICKNSYLASSLPLNYAKLQEELIPFCNTDEQNQLKSVLAMFENLKNMNEMMEMVQTMQELFPNEESMFSSFMNGSMDGFDFSQFFMNNN